MHTAGSEGRAVCRVLTLFKTIVATLAQSIPCSYREVKLFVPPGLGPDSSD